MTTHLPGAAAQLQKSYQALHIHPYPPAGFNRTGSVSTRLKPGILELVQHLHQGNQQRYQRTGSLFQKPFRRGLVTSDEHLFHLVTYIHRNPAKHSFNQDFRDWPFSSYSVILSTEQTGVLRGEVLNWFGNKKEFTSFHMSEPDMQLIGDLIGDDEV